ncbi:hypothetical protein [Trinickia acidisoli]|uniref:hypothetical protein n=1 Tax=Trinickia acidisoli TaxID=2767482 RepID=UPI001A8CBE8D|nr:hypothetical protein [Trinickia acidisoli]
MDIGRFLKLLQDPQKKQADLVEMRNNALKKGAIEHVHLAERVLDERFPSWRSPRTRRGGSKPTNVMFLGKTKHFPSEKEAYVWLMEEFTQHYPQLFEKIDWQTRYVAKGPRALYFAKSLKQLFHSAPDHGIDPNKYHRLMNGWYAKLVLSERQKVELLMKFATVANLRMGADWDWDDRAKGAPQLSADELLAELENAPQAGAAVDAPPIADAPPELGR